MMDGRGAVEVLVVGAGPCGLAAAIAAQQAGLSTVVLDRSCVVSGIASYPTYLTFFSTPEKLSIGGIPFVVATEKPTRRDALAYYRAVVAHAGIAVRQYETVERIERMSEAEGGGPPPTSKIPVVAASLTTNSAPREPRYRVHSTTAAGERHTTDAHAVVVATGYFGAPNRLGVPGEDLPHVTHLFREGHEAFQRQAVVVGGGNSAVEAVLDLHRSGARPALVHFGPTFDRNIKPWVLPSVEARMASGEITAHWNSRVARIEPGRMILETGGEERTIPADHVYLMLGYQPEIGLLSDLGVPVDEETGIPAHDRETMETPVPGVFIAGVIASGYDANKTFIENGRFHGDLIAQRLVRDA